MAGYELWQDGMIVAAVDCNDEELAKKEIQHYALVYSQDGPVKIVKKKRKNNGRKNKSS